MAKTRLTKSGWCAFKFKWNSDAYWSWGIALIMKYFFNENIQNIFFENKCKISEKQLEQLADLYAYNLKKSQSLTGQSC